jgi:hypothetical protein
MAVAVKVRLGCGRNITRITTVRTFGTPTETSSALPVMSRRSMTHEVYPPPTRMISMHFDTHDFQASPFYEGLGYVRFAELPDFPIGHSKIFLKKSLVA